MSSGGIPQEQAEEDLFGDFEVPQANPSVTPVTQVNFQQEVQVVSSNQNKDDFDLFDDFVDGNSASATVPQEIQNQNQNDAVLPANQELNVAGQSSKVIDLFDDDFQDSEPLSNAIPPSNNDGTSHGNSDDKNNNKNETSSNIDSKAEVVSSQEINRTKEIDLFSDNEGEVVVDNKAKCTILNEEENLFGGFESISQWGDNFTLISQFLFIKLFLM